MKRSRRENPADPPPTPPGGRRGQVQGRIPAAGGAGGGFEVPIRREKKNRTLFAHHQLQKAVHDELSSELAAIRRAVGDSDDVERFVRTTLPLLGATARAGTPLVSDLGEVSAAVKDALGGRAALRAVFRGRPDADAEVLVRTHPVVTGLARYVVESALDPAVPGPGRRCGVVRTRDVTTRTTLLLLRLRFHLHAVGVDGREHPLLAEETLTVGFTGTAAAPTWLDETAVESLLGATPSGNLDPGVARDHLRKVLDGAADLAAPLRIQADARAAALLEAHRRVRRVARAGAKTRGVDLLPPIDILGVYVYLPAGAAS